MDLANNDVQITFPITKIDKEKRLVSGFATLDNVDSHNDGITKDANKDAFGRWVGNIREMHQKEAVGKAVAVEEKQFFDESSGQTYDGIYVTARISKGAPNTWEKVLDGTLTGFSIGGKGNKFETRFDKAKGSNVRVITSYDLHELSLVDNPANPLARILSIEKDASGEMHYSGIAVEDEDEAVIEKARNVLYCKEDEYAVVTNKQQLDCADCGNTLKQIGQVEPDADQDEVVKALVADATDEPTVYRFDNKSFTTEESEAATKEESMEGNQNDKTPEAEDKTGEAAEVSEVEQEATGQVAEPVTGQQDTDVQKMVDGLLEQVGAQLTKAVDTISENVNSQVTEVTSKVDEFQKAIDSIKEDLTEQISGIGERVDAIENRKAIKKSADLEKDVTNNTNQDGWGGAFFPASGLKAGE